MHDSAKIDIKLCRKISEGIPLNTQYHKQQLKKLREKTVHVIRAFMAFAQCHFELLIVAANAISKKYIQIEIVWAKTSDYNLQANFEILCNFPKNI